MNLNVGMGLIVKPGETIPTKKSFFEGFGQATASSNALWVVAIILVLLFLFK